MAERGSRNTDTYHEEISLYEGSMNHGDEKTIPFLRRLRDMLIENEDYISFSPGIKNKDRKFLGRIIVHDRIQVESKILPRYFNHSSFASLRRQLNYFNFVRLGKGRQRESTYINENVVELDDILHLKRRPATSGSAGEHEEKPKEQKNCLMDSKNNFPAPPILDLSKSMFPQKKRPTLKRRRVLSQPKVITVSPRSLSPFDNNLISEDEHNESSNYDMKEAADDEFMTGCRDLLNLASKPWE